MSLKNKKAIITGAARGIGLTIAKILSDNDCRVIILDKVLKSDFENSLTSPLDRIDYYECDITDLSSRSEVLDIIYAKYKSFDILINNARYKSLSGIDESVSEWESSLNVSLSAPFFLSQEFILRSTSPGSIINVCSVASLLATSESPSYHAAKGGLLSLTKYLAVEGGKKDIRANAILPGLIVQDDHLERFNSKENKAYKKMSEDYQPMGEVGKESDVAEVILFLSGDNSKYISGASINIDGAATIQDQFSLINKLKL